MSKPPRQTSRPFCDQKTMEVYKAMKRRELQRRGRPVPSCLLPTEPDETSRRRDNLEQQTLPFEPSTQDSR